MRVFRESVIRRDTSLLTLAWNSKPTFIVLPDKYSLGENWLKDACRTIPEYLHSDHFVLVTSGTGGRRKLVVGSKSRAEQLVRVLHKTQESEPVQSTVLLLPLNYSFAFVNQWLWSRVFDRELLVTEGFANAKQLKSILSNAPNSLLCLVGSQLEMFDRFFGREVFPNVIRLHFAGGLFPQRQLPSIRGWFPNARIFNNYGCTEAMPRLTLRSAEDSNDAANIGRPIEGVELSAAMDGRLAFRSDYAASGIVDEKGFSAIDKGEWCPTDDLAELLSDGSWRLNGRSSEVIKRYGEKVSLLELKKNLESVCDSRLAFHVEKDQHGQDSHVLTISPKPSDEEVQEILQLLRGSFSRAAWPIRIQSVSEIPLSPNGKIDPQGLVNLNPTILWRQRL